MQLIVKEGRRPVCWCDSSRSPSIRQTYLKHREADVEFSALLASSLVGFLHDRHKDIFIICVFQKIPLKLESELWIGPETV